MRNAPIAPSESAVGFVCSRMKLNTGRPVTASKPRLIPALPMSFRSAEDIPDLVFPYLCNTAMVIFISASDIFLVPSKSQNNINKKRLNMMARPQDSLLSCPLNRSETGHLVMINVCLRSRSGLDSLFCWAIRHRSQSSLSKTYGPACVMRLLFLRWRRNRNLLFL